MHTQFWLPKHPYGTLWQSIHEGPQIGPLEGIGDPWVMEALMHSLRGWCPGCLHVCSGGHTHGWFLGAPALREMENSCILEPHEQLLPKVWHCSAATSFPCRAALFTT